MVFLKLAYSYSLHAFVHGTSILEGKIVLRTKNPTNISYDAYLIYLVPWNFKIYLHTLELYCDSEALSTLLFHISLIINNSCHKPRSVSFLGGMF